MRQHRKGELPAAIASFTKAFALNPGVVRSRQGDAAGGAAFKPK